MSTGTNEKVISDRGVSFIGADDELEPSVNFDRLSGSEKVTFHIQPSQKGPRANRVRLA